MQKAAVVPEVSAEAEADRKTGVLCLPRLYKADSSPVTSFLNGN